jgi:uncharacterized protein YjiS (DUF1127 family)
MEREMRKDSDFDYRKLTPEQWAELTHRVMREAHAARAQSVRTLYQAVLGSLRSAGAVGRRWAGVPVRLLAATAGKWWAAYDTWLERRRAVRALGALDDRSLKDMGLHRSEIESVVFGRSSAALTLRSAAPVSVHALQGKQRGNVAREPKQLVHCSVAA